MDFEITDAEPEDVLEIAQLWHAGWHDGHAAVMPAALTQLRTLSSFTERAGKYLPQARVARGPDGIAGFTILLQDQLYQMYVGASARGSGLAARLMADAENLMRAKGVVTAWLACAIGNTRAERFYEKSGWHLAGVVTEELETSAGPFAAQVSRFEKAL